MDCHRAFEIDLGAYLRSPRDPAWDGFRAHYPRCAACAAEVRAHTELGLLLAPEHPEPERLLALEDAPASLSPAERARLEQHVAGCASCRDELAALHRLAPSTSPLATAPPRPRRPRRGLVPAIGHWLWQPAVAWAAVLVLVVYSTLGPGGEVAERALRLEAPRVASTPDERRDRNQEAASPQREEKLTAQPVELARTGTEQDAATEEASPQAARRQPAAAGQAAPAGKLDDGSMRRERHGAAQTLHDVAAPESGSTDALARPTAPPPGPPAEPEPEEEPPAAAPTLRFAAPAGTHERSAASPGEGETRSGMPHATLAPAPDGSRLVLLRITVPMPLPADVEVALRAVDGRREMIRWISTAPDRPLELTLSADWLDAGPYDALLHDASGRLLYAMHVEARR